MQAYFYGEQKTLPADFDNYFDIADAAVVEMDMCRGHLDEGTDVTCPSPRGREIIESVNRFNQAARAGLAFPSSMCGQSIGKTALMMSMAIEQLGEMSFL